VAALLELRGISRSFGGVRAVRAVDLRIQHGEIVGLIGPNGAGKTTLFNVIAGAIRPDEGTVWLDGRDVTRLPPQARCRLGIARTFQLVRPFADMTLLDNVAVGSAYGREAAASRAAARGAAAAMLDLVGLLDRAGVIARQLTLVDRKRLELARALATNPHLLLLDELLAGLNPSEVVQAMDLVRRVRASGVTLVIVEHVVKAVFGVSDRIVVMSAGEKIAEGSPRQVAADPRVVDAYLGSTGGEAVALV
jgi:branched-chain amino acid transport system ATP-binding protein